MLEALGSNNPPPDRLHVHGSMWSEVFRYVKETLGGGEAED